VRFAPLHGPGERSVSRAAQAAWARLIKKVYNADPLVCPHCGSEMRFLAVIAEPVVIEPFLSDFVRREPRPPDVRSGSKAVSENSPQSV